MGASAAPLVAAALWVLAHASFAAEAAIGSGFSAMWFDPARSGEGLQLEILDTERALVEWYTYDEQGGQRWLQGVGRIVRGASGDSIEFPQIYVTHGGRFGASFDPSEVVSKVVGDATLSFSDCNTGTFHYDALGESQTLPIQRLTQTMGAGCAPLNGVPGQPVMPYAGQSGSWYDVAHSGEGFALQWLSRDEAIVTWYTYDEQGSQVWLLGTGKEQGGDIVFEHLARTHGPHFGTAYDPAKFQQEDWGTLTLRLDCSAGTAHYASNQPGIGSGDLTLTRLTKLDRPECPVVRPKLTDLYAVTWNEIPIAIGTPLAPNYIAAESIAEDGTIAARRGGHLALWHPDTGSWEDVPRDLAAVPVDISPDGSAVIGTDAWDANSPQPDAHTLLWHRSAGWQPLPGLNLSIHYAVSHNFRYVAGTGRNAWEGGDSVWLQPIDGAQQVQATSNAVFGGIPYAVAGDGSAAVGITLRFPTDYPEDVAVRWINGQQPVIMHDPEGEELAVASACDDNCDIVFGAGLYDYVPNHAHPGEAWFLTRDAAFDYLGALADALPSARSYAVTDATPDGSLAVGAYSTIEYLDVPSSALVSRAFLWTQATGIVSVRSLVDELGIGDDDWDEMNAVRVSLDGRKVLLAGLHRLDEFPIGWSRAVVLQLSPKIAN